MVTQHAPHEVCKLLQVAVTELGQREEPLCPLVQAGSEGVHQKCLEVDLVSASGHAAEGTRGMGGSLCMQ